MIMPLKMLRRRPMEWPTLWLASLRLGGGINITMHNLWIVVYFWFWLCGCVCSFFALLILDILGAGVHGLCPQIQVLFGFLEFFLELGFGLWELWIFFRMYRGWNFLCWKGDFGRSWVCFEAADLGLQVLLGCGFGYPGDGDGLLYSMGIGGCLELNRSGYVEAVRGCLTDMESLLSACCMWVGKSVIGDMKWIPPNNSRWYFLGWFEGDMAGSLGSCMVAFWGVKGLRWVGCWWGLAAISVRLIGRKDGWPAAWCGLVRPPCGFHSSRPMKPSS
ncbi:hypothetical protein R6Q59_031733 [Mikania micrantha]